MNQTEERKRELVNIMSAFIGHCAIKLPDDVYSALCDLRSKEDDTVALQIYDLMFKNLELAESLGRPICQDTGIVQFRIRCGAGYPLIGELEDALVTALERATKETPLRPNVIKTFDEINTGSNTGQGAPSIWWEIVPGRDDCEICVYMAGGGSSMPGQATVLMPSQGYEAAAEFVLNRISAMGPNACPPLLVGVGMGNSAEIAAMNSKHALMRPVGSVNENEKAAEFECMLEDGINKIGIGPQGIGGRYSVMGVNVVNTARHPACMGVALSVGCWVHRRGIIRLGADNSFSSVTHSSFEIGSREKSES